MENNIDACCHCAYCYERLERPEQALRALLRSFTYDRPRAEVCCELGRWFFQRENLSLAAYWYALALTCVRDDSRGGFVSPDCYGYLPCIQLCVCYSRCITGPSSRAWRRRRDKNPNACGPPEWRSACVLPETGSGSYCLVTGCS